MIPKIKSSISNFFLHIEINTLNVPYTKLPRPYRANWVSKLLRKVFEKKWIHKVFGYNLVAAMLVIPGVSALDAEGTTIPNEPVISVVSSELISAEPIADISTQPREFILPVERLRYLGQGFGMGHPAYDLNSYVGDDVLAFSSGRVHYIENGSFGFGRYIILDHGHDLFSLYAHLKDFNVSEGDVVQTGDKIGEVGMTGYTTGPHLHFEVHENGRAINPGKYLILPK